MNDLTCIAYISPTIYVAAETALKEIHERGFAHGDVRLDNFVVGHSPEAHTVMAIDLARSCPDASPDVLEREAAELRRLLEERTCGNNHHHVSSV